MFGEKSTVRLLVPRPPWKVSCKVANENLALKREFLQILTLRAAEAHQNSKDQHLFLSFFHVTHEQNIV